MNRFFPALALAFLLAFSTPLWAELHPIKGPATGKIGDMAEIKVPKGYLFFAKDDMKEFMEVTHNIYEGDELGVLYNPDKKSGFFAYFDFDDTGYIKDASKEKLDADAMWKEMKDNEPASNEERRKLGYEELELVKWAEPPQYNPQTQRLEWAEVIRQKGKKSVDLVNYNTRILGRKGVMRVTVVPQVDDWQSVLPTFNLAIGDFNYTQGNRYAEWTTGDKVADIGLAALVVGGAGALAAKTGLLGKLGGFLAVLFAKLGKLILVALVAVGGFFKRLFGGGKASASKNTGSGDPPSSVVQ